MWALNLVSQVKQQSGDANGAIEAAIAAVARTEKVRSAFRSIEVKTSLFNNIQEVFENAIDLLALANRYEEAFVISEQARARATLELVRSANAAANILPGEDPAARPRIDTKPRTLAQIRQAMPNGTALISYHVLAKRTVAWKLTQDGLRGISIDTSKAELGKNIDAFRSAIEQERTTVVNQLSTSLYQQLITPLQLADKDKVIIVAHATLHFLPFQALKSPLGWFIQERPISYALSASALRKESTSLAPSLQRILALGNPDVGNATLDLPGSEQEVRQIEKLYASTQVHLRKDASRSRVISDAAASGVLHIAAHALVDEIDPMHSYILLASPTGLPSRKDGQLEALDLQRLKLSGTGLVTLSACNSGVGRFCTCGRSAVSANA